MSSIIDNSYSKLLLQQYGFKHMVIPSHILPFKQQYTLATIAGISKDEWKVSRSENQFVWNVWAKAFPNLVLVCETFTHNLFLKVMCQTLIVLILHL